MSIFKSKAIIIKIIKIAENNFLYDIFSEEYWIIQANVSRWKKEKSLDIWYLIDSEISVKPERDIHSIYNIKLLWEIQPHSLDFKTLYCALELFSLIKKRLPKWASHKEIFHCLEEVILFEKNYTKQLSEDKIYLIHIKILELLWDVISESNNPTTKKILNFIYKNKPDQIIKLTGVDANLLKTLISSYQ